MSSRGTSVDGTDWAGSPFTNNKPEHTFRILYHNINSLGTSQYHHNIQELVVTQQELQVDLAGFTEHCLNATQPLILNSIRQSLNRQFLGQYVIQMNSAQVDTLTPYLPGGTASLLIGNQIARLEPMGRGGDTQGRWSFLSFRRKQLPPLTIYTAYKVNKQPTNQIGITAWHQQRLQLNAQQRHGEHPREAFTPDLIESILYHKRQHHHIIVGGDFNNTLLTNQSQLLRLASATNLIDPWTVLYLQFESFNSYQRGSTRIDSLLISHDLIDSIRHIGYSPFNWFTSSDHRAILVDFDTRLLFRDKVDLLHLPRLRGLKSNDKQQVAGFIEHCCQAHLMHNGAFDHLESLLDGNLHPQQVESIDKIPGQAIYSAESKIRHRRHPFFSAKLAQLRTSRSTTLANHNSIKHNQSKTYIFQQRVNRHGIDYTLSDTLQGSWEQYQSIKSELSKVLLQSCRQRSIVQQDMIEKAINAGNKEKERIVRTIARQEARKKHVADPPICPHATRIDTKTGSDRNTIIMPKPFTNLTSTDRNTKGKEGFDQT
jgi:hypothetical protein